MPRLIDADALRKELAGWIENTNPEELNSADRAIIDCIVTIDAAPTVDAVAVVRCRDCRFAQPISERAARAFDAERVRDCTAQRGDWKMVYGFSVVAADGYCDEGERKEPAI